MSYIREERICCLGSESAFWRAASRSLHTREIYTRAMRITVELVSLAMSLHLRVSHPRLSPFFRPPLFRNAVVRLRVLSASSSRCSHISRYDSRVPSTWARACISRMLVRFRQYVRCALSRGSLSRAPLHLRSLFSRAFSSCSQCIAVSLRAFVFSMPCSSSFARAHAFSVHVARRPCRTT